MDIFHNKIIYSYKFIVFGISLIIQIIVFGNKLLGRCFFPVHYFSQNWLHKTETIFKPKTSEWQDTHTTHTEGDNDNQLIVHISPHGMCYDAKNKNKVTMEDWNLGKKLYLMRLFRKARAAILKHTGLNCTEKLDCEKFHSDI